MGSYLSKDQIVGADDRPTRDVDVPEWGGTVRVRALSGSDRDAYEASMRTVMPDGTGGMKVVADESNARAKLAAHSMVDENGERLFGDHEVSRLGLKSAEALHRVFMAAAELSGLTDDAEKEIEGNSEAAPGGGSSSDSPATSDGQSPNS
jgi:hypothetical protein